MSVQNTRQIVLVSSRQCQKPEAGWCLGALAEAESAPLRMITWHPTCQFLSFFVMGPKLEERGLCVSGCVAYTMPECDAQIHRLLKLGQGLSAESKFTAVWGPVVSVACLVTVVLASSMLP